MKNRPKAYLKNPSKKKDCFVDGVHRVRGTCSGIPLSNRCAACRLRKNAVIGERDAH